MYHGILSLQCPQTYKQQKLLYTFVTYSKQIPDYDPKSENRFGELLQIQNSSAENER